MQKCVTNSTTDMSLICQEILSAIFEMADSMSTYKSCRLVCKKWLRINTPLLFRFVHHANDLKGFGHIIAERSLSVHIRHISLKLGSTVDLSSWLAQHKYSCAGVQGQRSASFDSTVEGRS